jgi:hypothetical protein
MSRAHRDPLTGFDIIMRLIEDQTNLTSTKMRRRRRTLSDVACVLRIGSIRLRNILGRTQQKSPLQKKCEDDIVVCGSLPSAGSFWVIYISSRIAICNDDGNRRDMQ